MLQRKLLVVFISTVAILIGSMLGLGGAEAVQVQQNRVFEASIESSRDYNNPLWDVSTTVTFTSPTGKKSTVDAFWDGKRTWRVRFSPDELGNWAWESSCSDVKNSGLNTRKGMFECIPYNGSNPLYKHGPIKISDDGRYFVHSDGTPFFWLADTAWNGVMRAKPEDWDRYLWNRKMKGFNAVQVILTDWRGFDKDSNGESSYSGKERIHINPGFFQRMDAQFAAINERGLLAIPSLLWVAGETSPGTVLPEADAIKLARYINARWGAHQVIWMLAGDGGYTGDHADKWKRIGKAVFTDRRSRLATMHPGSKSWVADEFRNEDWYDFIGYQSGHGDSLDYLKWLTTGPPPQEWKKDPPRPIVNLEPNYEGITTYNTRTVIKADRVRRAMYWSLMVSPTAGITYGHNGIWPWGEVREQPLNHSGMAPPWHESMDTEGVESVLHLKSLFLSIEWWKLRPAQELLSKPQDPEKPELFISATMTEDRTTALLYSPKGGEISIKAGLLKLPATAKWFNPRNGEIIIAGNLTGSEQSFTAPDENDWVLCLNSDSRTGNTMDQKVAKYNVLETVFESDTDYTNPFLEVDVKVKLTAPSGKVRIRDAFWDGGRTWRIRFSPDEVGRWQWHSECSDTGNKGLHALSGEFLCVEYTGDNPLYKRGPIGISKDGFFLEHRDGTPFFWLGDTGWAGVLVATPDEWDHYLTTRKDQGFSLIQVCATHYNSKYKDKAGESFYSEEDGLRMNPAFFQRVDDNFAAINRHGMMIASVILWESKGNIPVTNLPADDIIRIARYIVARYDAYQIAWILGGDGSYFQGNRADHWRKIGRGVFSEDRDRLVTIHPSFWAGDLFRDEPWHDFIGYQSGHGDSLQAIRRLTHGQPAEDWKNNPPQPVINIEPCYEAVTSYTHKVQFDAKQVRRALYWSLLVSPTAGVTYGHNSVYQWYDGKAKTWKQPVDGKNVTWREALKSEGAVSVVHLKQFFAELPWWKLRPVQELIVKQPSEVPEEYVMAAKTDDGKICLVFLPKGAVISLRTESLASSSTAKWFNPATGELTDAGNITKPVQSFTAPNKEDWVLYIKSST